MSLLGYKCMCLIWVRTISLSSCVVLNILENSTPFTTVSFLIQYRHGLWRPALDSMDIRTEGYVFTDNEMVEFYNHFYATLQKKLASIKAEKESVRDIHLKEELIEVPTPLYCMQYSGWPQLQKESCTSFIPPWPPNYMWGCRSGQLLPYCIGWLSLSGRHHRFYHSLAEI